MRNAIYAKINPQSWKNGWYTLSDLGGKETPFPNSMLIQVMLSEALPDPPALIWWGRGRIMVKLRTSAFCWTMSCSIFYFSGKHGDSCNKLHWVSQLFFFQGCRYIANNEPHHIVKLSLLSAFGKVTCLYFNQLDDRNL